MISVAVGKRGLFGSSAQTDGGVDVVFSDKGNGFEWCSNVRIVAKGGIVCQATCTVKVLLSWLQLHAIL